MRRAATCAVAGLLAIVAPAAAQTTSRPGPWVLDIRGVTSPVPTDAAFYPFLESAIVPSRGFGLDAGVHLYVSDFGPARIGLGANVIVLRSAVDGPPGVGEDGGSTQGQRVTLTMRSVAPQISANFGTRNGWSYLSAGIGLSSFNTETANVLPGRRESGRLRSVNFGGGARWFIKERLAFGIDLRAHQVAAGAETPRTTMFAVGAGFSMR